MTGHGDGAIRLATARDRLAASCDPHGRAEHLSIDDARGRILAGPVDAQRAVPHYDRAAMDGYAVRAADVAGADSDSPVTLTRTDSSIAGGEARSVHTGSPIPDGADAVVRVEATSTRPAGVDVTKAVPTGKNVADAGEDVESGERLFEAGHRLQPADLALLRATGVGTVPCVEPPQVAVVPTGDELVTGDREPRPGETVETNSRLVASLVGVWGGEATTREVVPDDIDSLVAALQRDVDRDVIVTTGGSSVGERDLVPDALGTVGEVTVHGVAIKPGHPVGFGRVDGTLVFVLPGYPVSCLLTAALFVRPALAWLAGGEPPTVPRVRARAIETIPSTRGKRTFARVQVVESSTAETAAELPGVSVVRTAGAGVLSSVTEADGWVEVPEETAEVPAGECLTVTQLERG